MSLVGYRWWIAARRPGVGWQLQSLARPTDVWWEGPHLAAQLAPRGWRCRRDERCDWGRRRCHCGIYAFKSAPLTLAWAPAFKPWALRAQVVAQASRGSCDALPRAAQGARFSLTILTRANPGPRETYPVWGAVALWGRVVEHELGYRAEHAMIRRLLLPRRIVIVSPCSSGASDVSGDMPTAELAEIPDAIRLFDALALRYGIDVELGDEIEIVV